MPSVASPSVWGGNVAWVVVFLANLIVPLMYGWEVTGNGGRVGMVAATALAFLLALYLAPKWSELRMTLVVGGLITAITQAIPFLQFVVGLLSLHAVHLLGFEQGDGHSLTEPGGFLATLLTAFLMLTAAFMCGVVIRSVGRAESWVLRGDDWPGRPADWQIQQKLRERQV